MGERGGLEPSLGQNSVERPSFFTEPTKAIEYRSIDFIVDTYFEDYAASWLNDHLGQWLEHAKDDKDLTEYYWSKFTDNAEHEN